MSLTLDSAAWDRIADLFERAREIPTAERDAFLDRETADRPQIGVEVREMFAAEESPAMRELEAELGESAREEHTARGSFDGLEVGPYRFLHLIGRGGMGDVYLGERRDGQFAQRLAIKVLRNQFASSFSVDRFERERRIQATLSHPSILALIDAGVTPEGHPFLVLPHVEGLPLTRFADERRLSIPERLRPFIEVCRAVQYAHSRFVVHRDIKPSNILVLEDGSVRLLDFGIAKLISDEFRDGAEETRELVAPMTPERAAPEQLRGEPVSTATDVWGLGVLLFELMTGRLPFEVPGQSPSEIEKKITAEGAPELWASVMAQGGPGPLASTRSMPVAQIQRWLRGDLAVVVAKALHIDPRMRYASVADLAADVENVLAQEPVSARPDTAWYRIRRAASRRPALASAIVVSVIGLATVASVSVVSARRVARERDRAAGEEARARAVVSLLVDIFGATAPAPGNDPQTVSIDALLTQGEARVAALKEQPEVQAEMYATLAHIRTERSEFPAGRVLFEKSLDRYKSAGVSPASPGPLGAMFGQAALLQRMDAPAEAAKILEAALVSLQASSTNRARALHMLGESIGGPRGEELARNAVSMFRAVGASSFEVAGAQNSLAVLHFGSKRMADAHALWKQVLPVLERDLGPDHPDTLRVLNNLSASSPDQASSVATLRRLIQSHERLLGATSAPLSNDWNNLGAALAVMREYEEAEDALRTSLAMRRKVLGESHKETISTWRNVARVIEMRGRFDDALQEFIALDRLAATAGRPLDRAAIAVQRAQVLLRLGRVAEAEKIAQHSLKVAREGGPSERLNVTNARFLLGRVALVRGDAAMAMDHLSAVLKEREQVVGPANPRLAEARAELGRAKLLAGDATGRSLIEDALPDLSGWGVYHPDDVRALEAAFRRASN